MTELTLAGRQTERFHETEVADERTRHLVSEWMDAAWLIPDSVAGDFGLMTISSHMRSFAALCKDAPALGSASFYLQRVKALLDSTEGLDQVHALRNTSLFLADMYGRQVAEMRHSWVQGYFPRRDTVRLDGKSYDIYNHMPALRFTGNVEDQARRDFHTGKMHDWLVAEFDTSPMQDESGDFVPCDPDVPVVLLPCMTRESYVDRGLAVAHLRALQASMAPSIADVYAPHLQRLLAEEEAEGWRQRKGILAMAQTAFSNVM